MSIVQPLKAHITLLLVSALVLSACHSMARTLNGFDVSNASIPVSEIFKGGPLKGEELELKPSRMTSWQAWVNEHPDTMVLSRDTGHRRNYDRSPYGDYEESASVMFPVSNRDSRYHPKTWTLGLTSGDKARAWPFKELDAAGSETIRDEFDGRTLIIHYDAENRSARVTNEQGETIPSTTGFWFAWHAFHPETSVFTAE